MKHSQITFVFASTNERPTQRYIRFNFDGDEVFNYIVTKFKFDNIYGLDQEPNTIHEFEHSPYQPNLCMWLTKYAKQEHDKDHPEPSKIILDPPVVSYTGRKLVAVIKANTVEDTHNLAKMLPILGLI